MSKTVVLRRLSDGQSFEANTNLADPPLDPVEAEKYPELFALWSELQDALKAGRMDVDRFAAWDDAVRAILRPHEIARLEKPLRPGLENDAGTIQYARGFHLTKILWARQGLEQAIADTGF